MSGQYDPRSAAFALRDTIKRLTPKIESSNVPGLVNTSGESIATEPAAPPIEGLIISIAELANGTATVPNDFDGVAITRDGLKAHVRPDGGVCIGFFGNSPADAVVMYGDPLMEPTQAKRIVFDYWKQAKLGPFATSAEPETARPLTLVPSEPS